MKKPEAKVGSLGTTTECHHENDTVHNEHLLLNKLGMPTHSLNEESSTPGAISQSQNIKLGSLHRFFQPMRFFFYRFEAITERHPFQQGRCFR